MTARSRSWAALVATVALGTCGVFWLSPAMAAAATEEPRPGLEPGALPAAPLRINKIHLEGCQQLSCRSVKSILRQERTPWYRRRPKESGYDPFWAEDDRRRIELFYRSHGFYSVRVEAPLVELDREARGVKITYRITEGQPVLVDRIEIVFEEEFANDRDLEILRPLLTIKAGKRFELEAYQESADIIDSYYQDDAYYRSQVTRRAEVDPEAGTATVTYRVKRGVKYKIRTITVEGCERTGESVVRRAMKQKEGDKYERNRAYDDQRRIQSLPIYRSVRVTETPDDDNYQVDLTVRVEEGKPRLAKVGVGYGSEEGVRGQVTWRHVNLFGGARELETSARWSELLEREQVKFTQPNLPRPGDYVQVLGERKVEHEEAYTHESVAVSPTYHFTIHKYLWAEASYRVEQNLTSRVINLLEVEAEDLAREGLLSALSGRLEWSDLDDPINPTNGARAGVFLELGGGPLGGSFSYVKAIGEFRGYYPILPPVVGAVKWKLGWAEPYGDLAQLPLFKRYFIGGTGSVRGFDRFALGPEDPDGKPIGGVRMWEGSLELRFPVASDLGGVVFWDTGWVWPEGEEYDARDVISSVGAGIRYETAVGPLSLDIGFPIEDDPDIANFRIHFNIGHAF